MPALLHSLSENLVECSLLDKMYLFQTHFTCVNINRVHVKTTRVVQSITREPLTQALRGSSAPNPTSATTDRTPNEDSHAPKQTPPLLTLQSLKPNTSPNVYNNMASRIPSALRSAALARPTTTLAHNSSAAALRRSFQTSQRMQETVIAAAPVRKPVGAFRGT
jgi:hypothetical protein